MRTEFVQMILLVNLSILNMLDILNDAKFIYIYITSKNIACAL